MKTKVFDNAQLVSEYVAMIFASQIINKPNSIIGLATGSSPEGVYNELISYYKKGFITFKDIVSFNLDEYCGLPTTDKNSYAYYMNNNFFNHIDIKRGNVNIPNGNARDMENEAKEYEDKIESYGGIDIQLLGIGVNGHLGFNEPDVDFQKKTHLVKLTQSTIDANLKYFESLETMPKMAISMGIKSIVTSKKIILIATGESKADAVNKAINGLITPDVPASILQVHPDATFIMDKAAAKYLQ